MGAPSNTYVTSSVIGIEEDVSRIVSNVSPVDQKFMKAIGNTPEDVGNIKHEWLTDTIEADADNAQAEGDDRTAAAIVAATRLYNTMQIQSATYFISKTTLAMKAYGGVSKESYISTKKMKKLAKDEERAFLRGVRNDSDNRQMRGKLNWITTNLNKADDATLNADGTVTGGTNRAFGADIFKNTVENIYLNSIGEPDTVYTTTALARKFTELGGAGNYRQMVEKGKLDSYVDVYATEFDFVFKIKPHRLYPSGVMTIIDHSTWKKAVLRAEKKTELASVGDNKKFDITVEHCLEARAESANGRVTNLLNV